MTFAGVPSKFFAVFEPSDELALQIVEGSIGSCAWEEGLKRIVDINEGREAELFW